MAGEVLGMIRRKPVLLLAAIGPWLGCGALSFGQTIELRPVSSTVAHQIMGNEIRIAAGGPGVEIELHVMASGWETPEDPNTVPNLGVVQCKVDGDNGFVSGAGVPLRWKNQGIPGSGPGTQSEGAFQAVQTCFFSGRPGCPSLGTPASGQAPCVTADPNDGPCVGNPEFVLYPDPSPLTAVAYIGLSYEFLAVTGTSGNGALDQGTNHYLGTAVLEIPAGAAGTYTIGFVNDPLVTLMADINVLDIPIAALTPASIVVGEVNECTAVLSSDPANCVIDARQPYPIDNAANVQGWSSLQLTFNAECDASMLAPEDFGISGGLSVAAVSGSGSVATVTFSGIIPRNEWTCVSHLDSGADVCLGFLPGDVNGSRTSNSSDITALINALNGVTPLPIFSTDANRSGTANAGDISALINLLNGAGAFDPWLGQRILAACPSAP